MAHADLPSSSSVVGSVGHILRNSFKDLYAPPPPPPRPATAPAPAPVPAPEPEKPAEGTKVSPRAAAAAAKGAGAKEKPKDAAAAAAAGAKGGKAVAAAPVTDATPAAAPEPAAAPPTAAVPAPPPTPDDPALAAELLRIATARDDKLGVAARVRAYLAAVAEAAAGADAAEAAALRRLGLVLKSEVPQGASALEVDRGALAGFPLLVAAELIAAAGARHATRRAPPFTSTEGVPHYIAPTAAQEVRNKLLATRRAQLVASRTSLTAPAAAPGPETSSNQAEAGSPPGDGGAATPQRRPRRPRGSGAPFNAEQADIDAKILARMAHASSFLRNPRQAEGVTAGTDGGAPWFEPEPRVLEYTDYAVGVPCPPRTIALRNSSRLTRSLRVLPAATRYFVIERVTFPTAGASTVAPGMAVLVTLRFTPDALSDFTDALTVVTEQGEDTVPLRARRAPPVLDLPPLLDLGCCLPGDGASRVYTVTNAGATSRLKLFAGDEWPPADPGRARPAELRSGAFIVSPTEVTIGRGDSVALAVRFAPPTNGAYEARLVLVADNLQVFECTCRGLSADLDTVVASVQGCPLELAPPGGSDATRALQSARLRFESLTPRASATKRVTVQNRAALQVAYRWTVAGWNTVGPRPPPPSPKQKRAGPVSKSTLKLLDTNQKLAEAGAASVEANASAFSVSPAEGVLAPGAVATFDVCFTPGALRDYTAVALLEVLDVPTAAAVAVAPDLAARRVLACALAPAAGAARREMGARTDLLLATLSLVGAGAEASVCALPSALAAPPAFAGARWAARVRVASTAAAPTRVEFGPPARVPALSRGAGGGFDAGATVCVEPSVVVVPPRGCVEVTVTYTAPAAPGSYALDVIAAVQDGPPLALRVTGTTLAARVRIIERDVDLGLFVVGGAASACFTVENESPVPVRWAAGHHRSAAVAAAAAAAVAARRGSVDDAGTSPRPSSPHCVFTLEPAGGVLPPRGRATVRVACAATDASHRVRELLWAAAVAEPDDGAAAAAAPPRAPAYVRCRGEVQTPLACVSVSAWDAGVVFVGVPVTRSIALVNLSNLPAPFAWGDAPPPLGAPTAAVPRLYDVTFDPASGELGPKETRDVAITVTPLLPGIIDAPLVCDVRGLPSPLGLCLTGVVRALVVALAVGPAGSAPPRVAPVALAPPPPPSRGGGDDASSLAHVAAAATAAGALAGSVPTLAFGAEFPTFSLRRLTLTLFNLSGIPTAVAARVSRYEAADAPRGAGASDAAGRPLLGREHETTRKFASEAGAAALAARSEAAVMRGMLGAAAGVAFGVDPPLAPLPAFGSAALTITCTADLPGRFADDLVLEVPGLPDTRVPLRVTVVGSPLSFTDNVAGLTLAPAPALTWGQLVVDSPAVPKVFYVRNMAPLAATLSWRVRRPPSESPRRLVDVGLAVGDDGRAAVSLQATDDPRAAPPFSVSPVTATVAARGTASFTLSARPDACAEGTWRGVLLGDAAWEPRAPSVSLSRSMQGTGGGGGSSSSSVSRDVLCLALSATPVRPALTLDKRPSSDGLATVKFGVWDTQPEAHASYTRSITLSNALDTTLTFTASLEGPFKFASLATSAPRHPLAGDAVRRRPQSAADAHIFTLPPAFNIVAEVTFDKAAARVGGGSGSGGDSGAGDHSTRTVVAVASRLSEEYRGCLRIAFSNGSTQDVPLRAEVLRPMLVAAPPVHDFGPVHVERERCVTLSVGNPTSVDAEWSLSHMPAAPPRPRIALADVPGAAVRDPLAPPPTEPVVDDPAVFDFGARSGVLRGPTAPVGAAAVSAGLRSDGANAPLLPLRVEFKPKANVLYRSRFRFHVRSGEGFEVVLTGHGSYEELHDK